LTIVVLIGWRSAKSTVCVSLWFRFGDIHNKREPTPGAGCERFCIGFLSAVDWRNAAAASRMIATPRNRCSTLVDCSSGAAGAVCSEDVGGLIEGNYGPPVLQNDRRMIKPSQKYLVRRAFPTLVARPAME
jgi:hypothetical protein